MRSPYCTGAVTLIVIFFGRSKTCRFAKPVLSLALFASGFLRFAVIVPVRGRRFTAVAAIALQRRDLLFKLLEPHDHSQQLRAWLVTIEEQFKAGGLKSSTMMPGILRRYIYHHSKCAEEFAGTRILDGGQAIQLLSAQPRRGDSPESPTTPRRRPLSARCNEMPLSQSGTRNDWLSRLERGDGCDQRVSVTTQAVSVIDAVS